MNIFYFVGHFLLTGVFFGRLTIARSRRSARSATDS